MCPDCGLIDKHDDIAIHLMHFHLWETDKTTVWLREQVEEEAFYADV